MMNDVPRRAFARVIFRQTRSIVLFCSLGCSPLFVLAQLDHEPLATSDSLGFDEIFNQALENIPEYLETPVRENQAADFSAAGKRLISGQPSLQINYYNDSTLDNVGLREFEYGVQLPLWRPGQRRASRQLGEQYETQVETWKDDLAWVVAGRVRRSLADIAAADLGLQLQQRAVADAQRLVEVSNTLFNAGEVARLELMQAQSLLAPGAHAQETIPLEQADIERFGIEFTTVQAMDGTTGMPVPATIINSPLSASGITARYTGILEGWNVMQGEIVSRDQLLGTINSQEVLGIQQEWILADSVLQEAEYNLGKDKMLFEEGVISEQRLVQTRRNFQQARINA